jgi:hypothetical protein
VDQELVTAVHGTAMAIEVNRRYLKIDNRYCGFVLMVTSTRRFGLSR